MKAWFLPVLLWLSVLASALAVVVSTQESRLQFAYLEKLRQESESLRVDWGRYLLEQSTLGAYSRVEKVAAEQLKMLPPNPNETITLR